MEHHAGGGILAFADGPDGAVIAPACGRYRGKQVDRLGRDRGAEIPDRRQVVEDPERSAVGAQHQVVVLDDQVVHGDRRQVELERLPGLALVGREDDAALGSGVEHPLLLRIFPDDVERDVLGKRAGEERERLSVVPRPVQVGVHVVEHMGVGDHEGHRGVERRGLDHLDRGPLGKAGQVVGDVGPGLARVASQVHPSVVGADPDQPLLLRRFGHGRDRAVVFGARVISRDRPARPLLPPLVVAGQVGADRRPGLSTVRGPEEDVGGVVDHLGVVGRAGDRGRPAEAVLHVRRAVARGVVDVAAHHPGLARPVVVPRDDPRVLARVDDVRVGRVGDRVAGLAAAHVVPVAQRDAAAAQAVAGSGDRAQVLHRAGDVVRVPRVDADPVELADRQRRRVPGLAPVQADVDAAVVAVDDPAGVGRVDPEVVMVAVVEPAHRMEGLAAVDAPEHRDARAPDHVRVPRVDGEGRVVPGPLPQAPVARGQRPGLAAVVGTVEPPFSASIRA